MTVGSRVWPVFVAAAAVGAAILAGLLALPGDGADDERDPVPATADPVADLLAAYERSRTATFVAEQVFTRAVPGRGELRFDRRLVQRPPGDRLVVGGGAAEGRIGGRVVRCATAPGTGAGAGPDCFEGEDAGPYDDEVAAEVEALGRLVADPNPVYVTTVDGDGCFVLDLAVAVPSPPYGEQARFCFDAATGAPTVFEVRRPEGDDLVQTVSIRPEVTDADLRLDDVGRLPG